MDPTPQSSSPLEDIVIDSNPNSVPQVLVEEKYTPHNESLLKYWLQEARRSSAAHNAKGKRLKFRHELFGLPAILLPLIFATISGVLSDKPGIEYANVSVLALTGILSGVNRFFDYGPKSQRHFEYEAKYADLVTTVMVELSKERNLRIRADRFVEMVQSKVDNLGANAPLL